MKQLSVQTTTKYWVHADNLKEVEALLLFHLPMQQENEITNTIYFDNNIFSSYSDILTNKDQAKIVQAKWYGYENDIVHIERKIYPESSFYNKSVCTKESIQLPQAQVSAFLKTGKYSGQQAQLAQTIFNESRNLRPIIRCFQHRRRFQETSQLRITLDSKITMIEEKGSNWKRSYVGNTFNHLRKKDLYHFPFSVIEIQSTSVVPSWVHEDLTQRVYQVPFFSKYLHGVSHFFSDRIPMLPWWLNEMQKDIRKPPGYTALSSEPSMRGCVVIEPPVLPNSFHTHDPIHASSCTVAVEPEKTPLLFYAEKLKQLKPTYVSINEPINDVNMMSWLCAKLTRNQTILQQVAKDCKMNKKKKKRLELKIHFANERTFISWLQFSALLLTVSLGLVNFGDRVSKGSGAFFIVLSMILACYAQLRFQYRSWLIRYRGSQRFDDMIGPAVLCFVLVIALLVNFGLRVNQPVPVDPNLFDYNTTTTLTNITDTHKRNHSKR